MSIYYSGTFTRPGGVLSAIVKQLKLVNLKPVKKISVKFDPFQQNALIARDFLFHINTPRVQETNLNCRIRAEIVCDRSEPEVKLDLIDSGSIRFLANNLTVLEILKLINKHVSSKVEVVEVETLQTKASKTAAKRTRR